MNKFKSLVIGSILAAASITAFSQNANAAEFQYQHENFHWIGSDNAQLFNESKVQDQRFRELQEREAHKRRIHKLRQRQAREQRFRELREQEVQAQDQRFRELRQLRGYDR